MASSVNKVVIFEGGDGQWYISGYARNGKCVTTGGEGYKKRGNAIRAAGRVHPDAKIVVKQNGVETVWKK